MAKSCVFQFWGIEAGRKAWEGAEIGSEDKGIVTTDVSKSRRYFYWI